MQENLKLGSNNKKSIILSIKKNKLIKQIKKIKIGNGLLVFKIIESGVLDYSIKKIDNKCICSNNKPILKKDYINSYNHYIYVLDNFIVNITKLFYFIKILCQIYIFVFNI